MLKDKKVAILIAAKFHEEETTSPRDVLIDKGAQVDLVGLEPGPVTGKYGKFSLVPDKTIDKIKVTDYDGIYVPGGGAPEQIRLNSKALEFVKSFWATGKPIAAICHGPQVFISAKVIEGVKLTCYPGIRDDVKNAGAIYVDKAVCIDGQLITSRSPADLKLFNEAFVKALSTGFASKEDMELDALSALKVAISREKGAQEFYEAVAKKMTREALRNKFSYLATIEAEHFEQLFDLYKKISGGKEPELDIDEAEIGKHKVSDKLTSEEAIDLAINAEQKAYDFYRFAALKSKNKNSKDMFEYLASEELEHKRLLLLDKAATLGGQGHFQWATHFDIPPGMDDLW